MDNLTPALIDTHTDDVLNYAGINFKNANLEKANLANAILIGADFTGANLKEADLGYANLSQANLAEANLSQANLNCAHLTDANFENANLMNAILTNATTKNDEDHWLQNMAFYDPVTGVYNRQAFMHFLKEEMLNLLRSPYHVALLLIDLDHFKAINDSYGHKAGDDLLKEVAFRLQNSVRKGDIVGRLGGDEFIIFLKNVLKDADPGHIAKNILDALSSPCKISNISVSIKASVGICFRNRNDVLTLDDLITRSDIALYRAKHTGRSCYHYYCPELHKKHEDELSFRQQIRMAIQEKTLEFTHYPIIDMHTQKIMGYKTSLYFQNDEGEVFFEKSIRDTAFDSELNHALAKQLLEAAFQNYAQQDNPSFFIATF